VLICLWALVETKYSIILADPPWEFKVWSDKESVRIAVHHYSVMSLDEIVALPVFQIADKNCALFLWTGRAVLKESFEVIKGWGFEFKCIVFTWIKRTRTGRDHIGMGYYTRANPEYVLLGVKGSMSPVDHSVRELTYCPVREHSRKPKIIHQKIEKLFGNLPRIELFAREKVEGWHTIGDGIDGMDIRESLAKLIRG